MRDFAQATILHNLPRLTSLGCALLPFIAVHIAYLLAANGEFVDWCFPYLQSCTSISATGRHPPASFVFRGFMLPSAMLMMVFWWLHWYWLESHLSALPEGAGAQKKRHCMLVLGWLACVGLVLYVTVLGEIGELWRLQRKIGTVLFFSFTFLAQLLLASLLLQPGVNESRDAPVKTGRRMLRLCQLMLGIGVFAVLLQLVHEPWHDAMEDAIEWQLALLLQINFLLCARLWDRQGLALRFYPPSP